MRTSSVLLLLFSAVGAQAQDRTTEAGDAGIEDPDAECQSYYYAPVSNAMGSFPTIRANVTSILANDTVGQQKFLAMNSSIPNIAPRGTLGGDFSQVTYDQAADPDCWWTQTQCVTPKLADLKPDVASVPEPRTLGYGFDDGPACGHNRFYNYLAEQNQKATMFFIGSNVMWFPLEAQRAVADGHQICAHTWSHPSMTAATNEGAFAELWYSIQAIKLVTNVTPTCWRPPRGDVDDRIRYIATQLGLETIMWGFDSFDWEAGTNNITTDTVQGNYDSLMAKAGSGAFDGIGAIMLTHELNNYTMQTAMDNYPKLAAAFDHLVPIAVAQNKTQPYVETNYSMPSFADYIANHTTKVGSSGTSNSSSGPSQTTGQGSASALRVSVPAMVLTFIGAALSL